MLCFSCSQRNDFSFIGFSDHSCRFPHLQSRTQRERKGQMTPVCTFSWSPAKHHYNSGCMKMMQKDHMVLSDCGTHIIYLMQFRNFVAIYFSTGTVGFYWPDPFAQFFCKQTQRKVFCGWISHVLVPPSAVRLHRPPGLWRWWWRGHHGTPCPQRCCSPQPGGESWLISFYKDTEKYTQRWVNIFSLATTCRVDVTVREVVTALLQRHFVLLRNWRNQVKMYCSSYCSLLTAQQQVMPCIIHTVAWALSF